MNIKDNIRNFRKAANMTQKELATDMGVSVMTIQRYESGAATPTLDRINQLAEILGVTSEEILHGKVPTYNFVDSSGVPTTVVMLNSEYWKHGKMPQAISEEKQKPENIKQEIYSDLEKLNDTGKRVAAERVKELTWINRYTKKSPDAETSEE